MTISFKPMIEQDIPLWLTWSYHPQVSDVWFREGDEPREEIYTKVAGNGYDYPFIIYIDETPIGFIQCSDLRQYYATQTAQNRVFTSDERSFSIDIFIGEEDYLDKGYGAQIMKKFIGKLFNEFDCEVIYIDPSATNLRAIHCYEKAGFHFDRIDTEGIGGDKNYVMKMTRQQYFENE